MPTKTITNHDQMAVCVICLKMFGKLSDLPQHIRRIYEEAIETPSASVKSDASESKLQAESEAPTSMSSETLLNRIEDIKVGRKTSSGGSFGLQQNTTYLSLEKICRIN